MQPIWAIGWKVFALELSAQTPLIPVPHNLSLQIEALRGYLPVLECGDKNNWEWILVSGYPTPHKISKCLQVNRKNNWEIVYPSLVTTPRDENPGAVPILRQYPSFKTSRCVSFRAQGSLSAMVPCDTETWDSARGQHAPQKWGVHPTQSPSY